DEANSKSSADTLQGVLTAANIEAVTTTVSAVTLVDAAVDSLIARGAEVLIILKDKVGTSTASSVVAKSVSRSAATTCLVCAMDEGTVREHHVLGAVSASYSVIGAETAALVKKVLGGASARDLPVTYPERAQTLIDQATASRMCIELPQGLAKEQDVTL